MKKTTMTLLCTAGLALGTFAFAADPVAKHDKDNDSTLDLKEAQAAAEAHFDKLEKDKDGTLDANEVKGLIGAKAFKAADPDNDGTIDKKEYLALVEKLFKAADTDHDGTIDAKELQSPKAAVLKKLLD